MGLQHAKISSNWIQKTTYSPTAGLWDNTPTTPPILYPPLFYVSQRKLWPIPNGPPHHYLLYFDSTVTFRIRVSHVEARIKGNKNKIGKVYSSML